MADEPPDEPEETTVPLNEAAARLPGAQVGARATDTAQPPKIIGPYRLLQKAGEGGMGEVWLAEQTEPIHRRVALKIIKPGLDSKQVIARFEAERQALALMNHRNVAQVFDAGTTPEGRPYFVMEYVQGEPITDHCDRHRLSTRERLELFVQICDGVQHAHQKAIIHRDLKPSNVLVAMQDDRGVPKIIDFGVAKATAQQLTEMSLFTEFGVLIGTPEYMSPEQADPTAQDVDTRSDVYSLGVILYELLVGALPFEPQELRRAGLEGIRRMICSVEPPRPSARLGTLPGARSTDSANCRRVDVSTLRRQLSGDLDWIAMKALEKDRQRRYGAPADLASDIARHMNDEPVLAGPPSAAYRMGKFVRRHRFGVGTACVALVTLVTVVVAMGVQSRRIAREAAAKERVLEMLQELFRTTDPTEARGRVVTARDLVDQGVGLMREWLKDDAEMRADLMVTMGGVYRGLGLYTTAEPLLRDALETRQRTLGPEEPRTLSAATDLGRLWIDLGRVSEAEKLLKDTLETQKRTLGSDAPDTLRSMYALARTCGAQKRYGDAEALDKEVLRLRRLVLGPEHRDTLASMNSLAGDYYDEGRRKDAKALYLELADLSKHVLGPEHLATIQYMENLAAASGEGGEAEAVIRNVLEVKKRVLGREHPATLMTMSNLASNYSSQGRLKEAEALDREALEIGKRVLGPEHPLTLKSLDRVARDLEFEGRSQEAEPLLRDLLATRIRSLGLEDHDTVAALARLASILEDQGKQKEAEDVLREDIELRNRILGPEHVETLRALGVLSLMLVREKRFDQAEELLQKLRETRSRLLGPDHPDTLFSIYELGCVAAVRGNRARALGYLREAVSQGYANPWEMMADIDLVSLRGDPEFQAVLAKANENEKAARMR